MSVYIKGMEMPTERQSFQVTIKYNGLVFDAETGIQIAAAHAVPDHGDLIDKTEYRDEFMSVVYDELSTDTDWCRANRIIDAYDSAPTVIPADRAEKEATE